MTTKTTKTMKTPIASKTKQHISPKRENEIKAGLNSLNNGLKNLNDDKDVIKESINRLKESDPETYHDIDQIYHNIKKLNMESNRFYNKYLLNKVITMAFKAYDRQQTTNYFLKLDYILGIGDYDFSEGKLQTNKSLEFCLDVLDINTDRFFYDIDTNPDELLLYVDNRADNVEDSIVRTIEQATSLTKSTTSKFIKKYDDFKTGTLDEIKAIFAAARELGDEDIPTEYKDLLNLEDKLETVINNTYMAVDSNKARVYLSNLIMRTRARKYKWLNDQIDDLETKKEAAIVLIAQLKKDTADFDAKTNIHLSALAAKDAEIEKKDKAIADKDDIIIALQKQASGKTSAPQQKANDDRADNSADSPKEVSETSKSESKTESPKSLKRVSKGRLREGLYLDRRGVARNPKNKNQVVADKDAYETGGNDEV